MKLMFVMLSVVKEKNMLIPLRLRIWTALKQKHSLYMAGECLMENIDILLKCLRANSLFNMQTTINISRSI